jgi:hypothetical protein
MHDTTVKINVKKCIIIYNYVYGWNYMCSVLYTEVVTKGWPRCVKSEAVVLVTALSSAVTQEVNISIFPRSPDIQGVTGGTDQTSGRCSLC